MSSVVRKLSVKEIYFQSVPNSAELKELVASDHRRLKIVKDVEKTLVPWRDSRKNIVRKSVGIRTSLKELRTDISERERPLVPAENLDTTLRPEKLLNQKNVKSVAKKLGSKVRILTIGRLCESDGFVDPAMLSGTDLSPRVGQLKLIK